jgi:hypothetical protein
VDFSSVLVLIAAMNEEEGIGPTLSELKKTLDGPRARFDIEVEIIVVRMFKLSEDLKIEDLD